MDKLAYVHKVGQEYNDLYVYEFLFTDDEYISDIDGEDWDVYPASGLPQPPRDGITKVKKLKTEILLTVIQDSDTFSVWDSVDGVVSLAWEETKFYGDNEGYPENRIHFRFGETEEEVENKLFSKELAWYKEKK